MYFEEASLSVHGILIRKGATVFTTEPTASLAHAAKIYGRVERTSILLASLLQADINRFKNSKVRGQAASVASLLYIAG